MELVLFLIYVVILGLLIYFLRLKGRTSYEKTFNQSRLTQSNGRTIFDVVEEVEEAILNQWGSYTITSLAEGLFQVEDVRVRGKSIIARGKLIGDANEVYERLKERCHDNSYTPLLQVDEEEGKEKLILIPKIKTPPLPNPAINIILFLVTVITTLYAGAELVGVDVFANPREITAGIPFSVSVMLILGIHELGHYFVARSYGLSVTLPYFIPSPIGLGTFGAFIQMRSPIQSKTSLFDVGLAGPIMSLAASLICLSFGLEMSYLTTNDTHFKTNISILLDLLCRLRIPNYEENLYIAFHPIAFAGFIGLMVTAINLIPIGQLDGGHISYSIFSRKNYKRIAYGSAFTLALFSFLGAEHLILWLIFVFFIVGFNHQPPLNEVTKINKARYVVGIFALIIAFLIFLPVPQFKL